jgi:tRNA threonylcarbamoyladenosine biosynthesis protein TsaE
MDRIHISNAPEESFEVGIELSNELRPGDVVLLRGDLGAGKTLLTKGILHGLDFDTDEVTSPSFALVNLYKTPQLDVYHIDLWRIEASEDAGFDIGLEEIVDEPNAIVIVEWAERLGKYRFDSRVFDIQIDGDGDDARTITVEMRENAAVDGVK